MTAEREDALMRADRAELQSQRLRQQLVELQKKLGDFSSVRNRYVAESASSHLHAELAPASPPSQPLTSAQNLDSALSAQLDEQLTAAAVSASAGDADLKSAYAELASERGRFESAKAVLSTELAVLTQRLQELSSHV